MNENLKKKVEEIESLAHKLADIAGSAPADGSLDAALIDTAAVAYACMAEIIRLRGRVCDLEAKANQ